MNRWVVPNAFGCLSPKKKKSGAKVKDSSRGDSEVERVKKKGKKKEIEARCAIALRRRD